MAVPSSGAVAFSTVNSVFGYGSSMSGYVGKVYYWYDPSFGVRSGTFPGSNFPMTMFYGKSGIDEWNCACDCACNCGK
ncbi:hypothetical protein [Bradyrhizobium sp. SZCCHNRI2010]|uniref:hypothetical protein n=1 Tax=Bradyrhizobium sp. SZCCHNRI2010 TaxID=3057283 RepID=UPI0028F02B3E|nr:hypothetical protein [Bradyrhizobium sp. SZCCHNRI2010]